MDRLIPRTRVSLVQQGVWDMELESMPLAVGYLKAAALADDRLNASMEITIHNFRGGMSLPQMANNLFTDGPPDVIGFSVFGWNYRSSGALAETFKQMNPGGWVIFGGTHVSHQAKRVFRMFPQVDVVVNDEGEFIFRDLLSAYLDGTPPDSLDTIQGVSFQTPDGNMRTTPPRQRIDNLDDIPSPTLTGAIPMTDEEGRFRYDVALMETNRGCPYKCAFCYWGGAVGQKVRAFSRQRLRAELEYFAKHRVHAIVACDSNFGLLPQDKDFIDDMIEVREQYGFPRSLETSWAKNKSQNFYDIVRTMKHAGLRSSFTLALQTLDEDTLDAMNRRNMKVNAWEDLAVWLRSEGLDCYAELLWGAPGETPESFLAGYDRLTREVSRIAVYPMLLLPNTDYTAKKTELGIVTVRGDADDFEYVLATNTMTFADNQNMQRFMFWARVIAECAVLRHVWVALRELAGITQSQVLTDLDNWIRQVDDPAAEPLRDAVASAAGGSGFGTAIAYFYTEPEAKRLLRRWWTDSIRPRLPDATCFLLDEVFRYDLLTQPIVPGAAHDLSVVTIRDEEYYLRQNVEFAFDVPAIVAALRAGNTPEITSAYTALDLYYKTGAASAVTSTNHETIMHFMGMPRAQVMAMAAIPDADTDNGASGKGGTELVRNQRVQ